MNKEFLTGIRSDDPHVACGWVLFYLAERMREEAEKKERQGAGVAERENLDQ